MGTISDRLRPNKLSRLRLIRFATSRGMVGATSHGLLAELRRPRPQRERFAGSAAIPIAEIAAIARKRPSVMIAMAVDAWLGVRKDPIGVRLDEPYELGAGTVVNVRCDLGGCACSGYALDLLVR